MKLSIKSTGFIQELDYFTLDASNFSILETTKAFREKLFELIASAKQRIYLTALYLQDDEAGQAVMAALYQAKQNNPQLDVKVFVDYSRAQRGLMGQPESVGNVRLYREMAQNHNHPIDILGVPVKSKEVLGVLHIKGFVFDDCLLYSGASLNEVYLHQTDKYRYDRYQLIKSKALADSFVKFLKTYIVDSSAVKDLNQPVLPTKKQIKPSIREFKKALSHGGYHFKACHQAIGVNQIAITPLLGFGGRKNPLNQTIYEMVKNTERHLTLFTPYFNLPSKINRALKRLLKNGKKVDLIVGDKRANDFYSPPAKTVGWIGIVPYVYETNLRKFVKSNQKYVEQGLLNIQLWYHGENTFHLKGISADDRYYLLTGHNINPRAWSLDLENGVFIQDPKQTLKHQFCREKQQILTHTQRLGHFNEIETIKDYPEPVQKKMRLVKTARVDSISNRLL